MKEIADGLGSSRDNISLERAGRVLALCEADKESAALVSELEQRYPESTLTKRVSVPVIAAVGAVGRREWSRALAILEPVKPYDHAAWAEFWPAYLRGQAQLGLKRADLATAEFQSILDHRGEAPVSQLYALAQLGVAPSGRPGRRRRQGAPGLRRIPGPLARGGPGAAVVARGTGRTQPAALAGCRKRSLK